MAIRLRAPRFTPRRSTTLDTRATYDRAAQPWKHLRTPPPKGHSREDDVRAEHHVPWRGVASCLALTTGIVAADVAAGPEKTQYVGLLVAVPFLAATFTGVVGVLALGLVA